MINLLGALVLIFGFLSPFLIRLPAGRTIPSTILFCVGFVLLLKSNRKLTKVSVWLKWGRIGVLVNMLGFLLLILITILIVNTSLSESNFGHVLLEGTRWIFMPITSLSEIFFPYYEQMKMSDGSMGIKINFPRWTLASFFNVLFYIGFAIVIGKLISAKGRRFQ